MSLKLVAVAGMTLTFIPVSPGVSPTGTIIINTSPSIKSLCQGKGLYKHGTQITITNITDSGVGGTVPDPGPKITTINSQSGTKGISESLRVLLEGDETDTVTATPTNGDGNPRPTAFKIKITAAGQTKVVASDGA